MVTRTRASDPARTLDLARHSRAAAAVQIVLGVRVTAEFASKRRFLPGVVSTEVDRQRFLWFQGPFEHLYQYSWVDATRVCAWMWTAGLATSSRISSITMLLDCSRNVLAGPAERVQTIMKPPSSTWMQPSRIVVTCEG